MTKEELILALGMEPLPGEGGMWKKMFRSSEAVPDGAFRGRQGPHMLYGSILYLLTRDSFSRMHRLPTDELWHFYLGASCETLVLCPDGTGYVNRLGQDIPGGEQVTARVPRGCWQGTRITGDGDFALLGTTMAPDYENCDYENGTDALLTEYPDFADKLRPLLGAPRAR